MGSREILDSIRRLAGTFDVDKTKFAFCEVTSVDENKRTCSANPISSDQETDIDEINLMSDPGDGMLLIPKVGSTILIVYSDKIEPYVLLFSDLDKVKMNADTIIELQDGTFGGLVKINDLKTQYDSNIAAIKTACAAGFAAVDTALNAIVPGSGVSTVAFNAAAASILVLNKTTLENTKVKHGT